MKRRIIHLTACACALGFASACSGGDDGTGGGGTAEAGSIVFTISGEMVALGGFGFPRGSADEPVIVDGWEVKFSEVLVTVDKITLSESPDSDPSDQSKTGKLVAQVDGPWAVDLHAGGPLPGKSGGGEQAVQLATLDNQNKNDGASFAADTRYAFGYDVIPAAASAKDVNLSAQGQTDYQMMQEKGYTVLYAGTATFKGTSCTPSDAVFDSFPPVVDFKLGFTAPTTYLNCQNPDNDPAEPLGDEEHERGVIIKANQPVTAQLTIHLGHIFWDSFVHDSSAHFDMIAAQHAGATSTPVATLEDMKGVDPTAITDSAGNPVQFRTCDPYYTPPASGQLSFDTMGIPVNPNGDPSSAIRDMYDYMTYNLSTQGHLNSDGLCFVKRHYPSPP